MNIPWIKQPGTTIHIYELIRLAVMHLKRKKARTAVTVGGMAIGIGAIVFLVSVGYGLQDLVVSRVAELEELRQIHVTSQPGSGVVINDESLALFNDIPNVEQALPLISVVGRVNYQNSNSDVAVFGVTADYLRTSALQPTSGDVFESNQVVQTDPQSAEPSSAEGSVEGAIDVANGEIVFGIEANEWVPVRESPDRTSRLLGYTTRIPGKEQRGTTTSGGSYVSVTNGEQQATWINAKFLLWEQGTCEAEECSEEYVEIIDDTNGTQQQLSGYIGMNYVTVISQAARDSRPEVLGITTVGTRLIAKASASTLEVVEIDEVENEEQNVTLVPVSSSVAHEAVVNQQFLEVLGIPEEEAISQAFTVSFVITSNLLEDTTQKVESVPVEYRIVGVLPEDESPAIYVPFIIVRSLGVKSYSQVKVIAADQEAVQAIREVIEANGYTTDSILDTVAQINDFFATARVVLLVIGLTALVIAALGMFNTLTVSLLERTHEVGLMKAIGMKSHEVRRLFLVESLTMGFLGGVAGLLFGYAGGVIASAILTSIALSRGAEAIDVTSLPFILVLSVLGLAFVVGVVTGFYPARRATKISALNALRYE